MMPDNLLRKELMEDFRSRKALALKFLIPALLLLPPILVSAIPPGMKASILPLSLLFVGVFGSSIGLLKTRESGMGERLSSLPVPSYSMVAQYILANAFSDGLQLALPFAAFVFLTAPPVDMPLLLIAYVSVLVAANSLGALVALLADSAGEGHLYSVLMVMAVGLLSGVFMDGGIIGLLSALSPLRSLHSALLGGSASPAAFIFPVAVCSILFTAPLTLSKRLFRRGRD